MAAPRLPEHTQHEIRRLVGTGLSRTIVARRLGVSRWAVMRYAPIAEFGRIFPAPGSVPPLVRPTSEIAADLAAQLRDILRRWDRRLQSAE